MKVPQIFDRNMKRLAFLDNAVSVGYSLEINSLWTATFTLPADDDKNAYCQPLNFVEIFDGDERIDLFRIIGEDLERSNGATRFYDCEHVLATESRTLLAWTWGARSPRFHGYAVTHFRQRDKKEMYEVSFSHEQHRKARSAVSAAQSRAHREESKSVERIRGFRRGVFF